MAKKKRNFDEYGNCLNCGIGVNAKSGLCPNCDRYKIEYGIKPR